MLATFLLGLAVGLGVGGLVGALSVESVIYAGTWFGWLRRRGA